VGTKPEQSKGGARREARWILVAGGTSIASALIALVSIVDHGMLGSVPTGALVCVLALIVLPVPTLILARRARSIEARARRAEPEHAVVERVMHERHDDRRAPEHRVAHTTTRVHHGAA
jgi:hypothetical protein